MAVRRFDGVNDKIVCSIGANNITEAVSIWAMVRVPSGAAANNDTILAMHTSGGAGNGYDLFLGSEGKLVLWANGSQLVSSTVMVKAGDGWVLVGACKAAGSATVRFHKYVFSTKTWTRETTVSTLANAANCAGGTARFGLWGTTGEPASLDFAAVGTKNAKLTDEQFNSLATASDVETGWKSVTPSGLWVFKQALVTEKVNDLTAGGANETERVDTTVVGEEPPIPYKASTDPIARIGTFSGAGAGFAEAELPTTQANDVVIVAISNGGSSSDPTIEDEFGNTWNKLESQKGPISGNAFNGSVWWARVAGNMAGSFVFAEGTNSITMVGSVYRGCVSTGKPVRFVSGRKQESRPEVEWIYAEAEPPLEAPPEVKAKDKIVGVLCADDNPAAANVDDYNIFILSSSGEVTAGLAKYLASEAGEDTAAGIWDYQLTEIDAVEYFYLESLVPASRYATFVLALSTESLAVEGKAALSGVGTLAAAGTTRRFGASALSGAGSLSGGAATLTRVAAAQLSGVGALTASGFTMQFAAAAVTGSGSLLAAGTTRRFAAASMSGGGTLTASGEVTTFSELHDPIRPDPHFLETRYAVELQLRDGQRLIVGPDEAEAVSVPIHVQFDTELPGGFGPGQITIPKPEGTESTPARLFSGVRVYDADTGRNFYEGRITSISFTETSCEMQTEGWSKHLEDDSSASMVFYDRDLSKWSGPGTQQQIILIESNWNPISGELANDEGEPSIKTVATGNWEASSRPHCSMWYDAGAGNKIAAVDYAWKKSSTVNSGDGNWSWTIRISDDDHNSHVEFTPELRAAGPGSGTLNHIFEGGLTEKRYANVRHVYNAGPAGGANVQYSIYWTLLAVVGDHKLTLHGTVAAPDVGRGLIGSDVAEYVVARWAPLLNYQSGQGGSIEETTFVIPHLSYNDDTTARAMIDELSLLGGTSFLPLDWGVYDDKTFFMRTPGTFGRTWRVRKDQAVESVNSGPDASERLNGVVVSYDDGTGKKFTVGPIGSGCDKETSDLEDTDPTNPANEDGARHWKQYDAQITSEEGAIMIGLLVLADANTIQWRGDVTINGEAVEASGARFPVASVRSGDYLIVEDDVDPRPRRVVNTSLEGQSVQCSCGTPPDKLDVLLARNGIVLVGRL